MHSKIREGQAVSCPPISICHICHLRPVNCLQPVALDAIAEYLAEEGILYNIISRQAIQQQLNKITQKVIRLVNKPSADDLAVWKNYFKDPLNVDELPFPLMVEVVDERIKLFDQVSLYRYPLKDWTPVLISPVCSFSHIGMKSFTYVVVDVQYKGKTQGASVLRFDKHHSLIGQVRMDTIEEARELFNNVIREDTNKELERALWLNGKTVQQSH